MTTYYVDPVAGDDGDDGLTSGNAFATLSFTNAAVSAGDTVNMMDGHFAENLSATTTGSVGNVITWQAVNSRLCSIQRQIVGGSQTYQTFDGIKYIGDGTANSTVSGRSGITNATNNLTWNDCEVFGARRSAFGIVPATINQTLTNYPVAITIQNCLMDQCNRGITVYGKDTVISGNEIRDLRDHGTGTDADYMRPFGKDVIVDGNWCHGTDVANTGTSHTDCIQLFQNNGEINTGLIVRNNFFEVNVQGIFMEHINDSWPMDDITITDNIFIEPDTGATSGTPQMITSYGITNLDINHNTFIFKRDVDATHLRFRNSKGSGTQLSSGTAKDNIFIRGGANNPNFPANSPYPAGLKNVVVSNNISKDLDTGIAADFNGGIAIDPQLIDSAGTGYDAQGTFLDADATWRPDVGSRSLDAATEGVGFDLGPNIAIDAGGPPTDTEPPVITLIGSASIQIPDTDVSYTDAGATCSDNLDGVLVMTAGVHDTDGVTANLGTPGVYTYDWDRDDAAANSAVQVTRTVTITATDPATVYEVTIRLKV